jgi:hypothetical protein
MELEYAVILPKLLSKRDLWSLRAAPVITQQLSQQGRYSSNLYRYEVTIEIVEGQKRPVKDVDNYAKRTIDAITRTKLLWRDDEQIDTLTIRRKRDKSRSESEMIVRIRRTEGQHSGVPTFFRACCREASLGCQFTYAHPAYHLAMHLWNQQPCDLDEAEWAEEIGDLCGFLDGDDGEGVWNWFCEHFPKCMKLVPQRRMEQFVRGVFHAYEDERVSP